MCIQIGLQFVHDYHNAKPTHTAIWGIDHANASKISIAKRNLRFFSTKMQWSCSYDFRLCSLKHCDAADLQVWNQPSTGRLNDSISSEKSKRNWKIPYSGLTQTLVICARLITMTCTYKRINSLEWLFLHNWLGWEVFVRRHYPGVNLRLFAHLFASTCPHVPSLTLWPFQPSPSLSILESAWAYCTTCRGYWDHIQLELFSPAFRDIWFNLEIDSTLY